MKTPIAVLVAAAAFAAPELAAAEPPTGVGSCAGDEVSFFVTTYGGAPNAAAAFGLTVQEGHNAVLSLCGRTVGTIPL